MVKVGEAWMGTELSFGLEMMGVSSLRVVRTNTAGAGEGRADRRELDQQGVRRAHRMGTGRWRVERRGEMA